MYLSSKYVQKVNYSSSDETEQKNVFPQGKSYEKWHSLNLGMEVN